MGKGRTGAECICLSEALAKSHHPNLIRRYFGMMNQSLFPVVALAQIVNILFLNVFFLFGGFFVPYPQFPVWWKWRVGIVGELRVYFKIAFRQ